MATRKIVVNPKAKPIKNLDQAKLALDEIRSLQQAEKQLTNALEAELSEIRKKYQSKAEEYSRALTLEFSQLCLFAQANKDTLISGKKKSVEGPHQTRFGWRKLPDKLKLSDDEQTIVERIKRLMPEHFEAFTNTPPPPVTSLNMKELKIKSNRAIVEDIAGIDLIPGEETFFVETNLERLEISPDPKPTDRLRAKSK